MKKYLYFISYHAIVENGSFLTGNIDIRLDNKIDNIDIIRNIEKDLKVLLKKESHLEIKNVVVLSVKLLKEEL
jgi:hypothetical protein